MEASFTRERETSCRQHKERRDGQTETGERDLSQRLDFDIITNEQGRESKSIEGNKTRRQAQTSRMQ